MKIKKQVEFNNIINDILKNEEFITLRYEIHHGITRLDHSLKVAKLTYNITKFFKMKHYVEVTRASLLHDFFRSCEVTNNSFVNHPDIALLNAKRNFELNKMQENIIASHMFQVSHFMPKYKESLIVSLMDKIVAVEECTCYKIPLTIGASFLFFINFLIIQR